MTPISRPDTNQTETNPPEVSQPNGGGRPDADAILERMGEAFFALDGDWRFTYVNDRADTFMSRGRAEVMGRVFWEVFPHLVGTEFDTQYHRAVADQTPVNFELFYPTLNAWIEVRAFPASGGLSVFFRDVTEQAERRRRERLLAGLAERARALTDPDAVISDALRAVGEFLNVARAVFVDIDAAADVCVCHPDFRADETVASMAGTFPISAFGPVAGEYAAGRAVVVRDVRADRAQVPAWSVPTYEAQGIRAHVGVPVVHSARLVSCLGVHSAAPRDWTPGEVELLQTVVERTWLTVAVLRQQRALVREAEEGAAAGARTAALLESITDAFFALDADWRFSHVNAQAERVLQRPREALLGRSMWDEFPQAVGSEFDTQYRRAVADQTPVVFEAFYPPLDTWFEVRAFPAAGGGLSVFFQDVSARKRTEAEREKAEADRERLLAEQRALARREALLNRVGQALRGSPDPAGVLEAAVRELGEALGADRCYFAAYDQGADTATVGPDWRREALPSIAGRYAMSRFAVNRDPDYQAGRTQVVPDTAQDPAAQALGLRSLVRVPLVSGAAMTALAVAMAGGPRDWTAEEVSLIEAVAAQTRSAVEAARLIAERQARLGREALLGRIGGDLRSALDPARIQERAASLLGEALGADRCFYVTYDPARDHAQVSPDWRRADLPPLSGAYRASDFAPLLGELFPTPQTAAVADVRTAFSPGVAAAFEASRHRAVLVVPFFDGGRLTAALYVSQADAPRAWTADEAALAEQVATLTRTALEAARVHAREHAIARQLQDALQPALPDRVPGLSLGQFTQPALDEAEVGGDFFDAFPLDKELYALVIGDVSGKGLAAAQQLALIRNSLRTTLYLYRAPARACAAVSAIVGAHDLLVGFVTAWVGVYHAGTGAVAFCACGHEPALVRRAAGGAVEALATTGPPLGVSETAEYAEGTVVLSPGDALLLYTDGISESGPSRRALLGTDGLSRLLAALPADLAAQPLTDALVSAVSANTNGLFRDDVAVLLARRDPPPPR